MRPVGALHPLQRLREREDVLLRQPELIRERDCGVRRHLHFVRSDQERCPSLGDLLRGLLDGPATAVDLRSGLEPGRRDRVQRGLVVAALLRRDVEGEAVLLHGLGRGVDRVLVGPDSVTLPEENIRDPGQRLDERVVSLLRVLRRHRLRALGAREPVDPFRGLPARRGEHRVAVCGVPATRRSLRPRLRDVQEALLLLLVVVSELTAPRSHDRAVLSHDRVLGAHTVDRGVELPDDAVPHRALPRERRRDLLDGVAHVLVVRDQVLLLRDLHELLRGGVGPLPAGLSDDRRDGLHRRL